MTPLVDRFAVLLVALAAMLWGTDTLFRVPLLQHLSKDPLVASVQVVFAEHVTLTILVLPILWFSRRIIRRLDRGQWLAIVTIGVGASALATVFFTRSFGYGHFIETLLLQKTQPLIAILLARLVLAERLPPRSYLWMPIAIAGAYFIAIPDPFHPERAWADFHVAAAAFALAAAALWGAATVLGRIALRGVPFTALTALRFVTGMPALGITLLVLGGTAAFAQYNGADVPLYLGIALVPGLIPMLLYYRGLASTPASIATLAELAFPITGVLVNLYLVTPPQSIGAWQIAGIALLWAAIIALDIENARRPARIDLGASVDGRRTRATAT
jgi:drug/metabolite transporter (DMT)-like permease